MTSASELFYNRRHRLGRPPHDLGFDSTPVRDLHLNFSNRRRRYDVDDSDSLLRRSTPMRRLCPRSSFAEPASDRFDLRSRRSLLDDSVNAADIGTSIRGPRVTGNERLPRPVLLARARLLERLRGAPPSGDRGSLGIDEFNSGDQESGLTDGLTRGSLFSSSTPQLRRFQQELNKKPPGLTQDALDSLHVQVYKSRETGVEGLESKVLLDCSICLESFMDGEELIRLPCGHRFHSGCLDPWVRSCGDCPYCRRGIVVNSHTPGIEAE